MGNCELVVFMAQCSDWGNCELVVFRALVVSWVIVSWLCSGPSVDWGNCELLVFRAQCRLG